MTFKNIFAHAIIRMHIKNVKANLYVNKDASAINISRFKGQSLEAKKRFNQTKLSLILLKRKTISDKILLLQNSVA